MNHIKNDTRNRLGEILNELMILYDITEDEKATIDITVVVKFSPPPEFERDFLDRSNSGGD